jgi:NAD(P)H dehydrogenase (quinone)
VILVTGANGKLGRLIVQELLGREPHLTLAVSVRDPETVADLAERGVHVRRADYDEPASMRRAFEGVYRLALMPTPEPDPDVRSAQMRAAVEAAATEHVHRVIYLGAHASDRFDQPLIASHRAAEQATFEHGLALTCLRCGIYAQKLATEVQGAIAAGELAAPAGEARVAPVLRQDLAAAAATVLLEHGHDGKVYELTGPDTIGWRELAQIASERAGRPIAYRPIDDADAAERMRAAGVAEPMIGSLLGLYGAYRAGWCGTPTGDLERLAGRATPAADAVRAVLEGTAL